MRSLFNSAAWTLFSNLILSFSSIIGLKFVSDYSSSDEYGSMLYVYSNAVVIGAMLGLGVGQVVNQTQSTKDVKADTIYINLQYFFLLLTLLIVIVFLFLYQSLSSFLVISNDQLFLGVFIFVFYLFDNINRCYLIGNKRIKEISLTMVVVNIFGWIIIGVLIYFGIDNGFLYGMLLVNLLNCVISFYLVFSDNKFSYFIDNNYMLWVFKKKISPAFLSQLLGSLPQIILSTVLLYNYGAGIAAIYIIGMYIFRAVLFVPAAIQRVLMPYLGSESDDGKQKLIFKSIFFNFLVCLPFLFATYFYQQNIIEAYSFNKDDVGYLFLYIVLAGVFAAISSPIGQYITVLNKYYLNMVYNLIWALLYIISSLVFIYLDAEIETISLCMLGSYISHLFIGLYILRTISNEIDN